MKVQRIELGGPPTGDEAALVAWIAKRTGADADEVRAGRRRFREQRGIVLRDDHERVRAAVSLALDHTALVPQVARDIASGKPTNVPSRSTSRKSTARISRPVTTPARDPHRTRAETYGGVL